MPTLREELEEKLMPKADPAAAVAGVQPGAEIPAKPAQSAIEPPEPKPAKEPATSPKEPAQGDRPRDEHGKFVSQKEGTQAGETGHSAAPPASSAQQSAEPAKPQIGTSQPPPTWSTEAKALWPQLDEKLRAEIIKREKDALKGIGQYKRGHESYERFMQMAHPYLPLISAEGSTIEAAFKNYLDTASLLRLGTPEQKQSLILTLARQFGVTLPQAAAAVEGAQAQAQQQQEDPRITALNSRIQQLEQERARQLYQAQAAHYTQEQQQNATLDGEIEAFAEDPAHPHFETVREDMSALLAGGRAKTLQEAYDIAVWANPGTRNAMLSEREAAAERKRKEEEARRLEAARHAAGSVKSAPSAGTTDSPKESLRAELESQFRAAGARI